MSPLGLDWNNLFSRPYFVLLQSLGVVGKQWKTHRGEKGTNKNTVACHHKIIQGNYHHNYDIITRLDKD